MNHTEMIDLHMHTTCSDGTDTPEEIIARVRESGIGLFSVTDHDGIKAASIIPPLLVFDAHVAAVGLAQANLRAVQDAAEVLAVLVDDECRDD